MSRTTLGSHPVPVGMEVVRLFRWTVEMAGR